MWPETLAKMVSVQLAELEEEILVARPLADELSRREPNQIEIRAIAATMHTFYNGIERVLELIARTVDESVPEGPSWHRDLLMQMAESNPKRPPLLSAGLRESLQDFLGFRHYFRHSYSIHLEWNQMKHLVSDLMDVYYAFRQTIDRFLDRSDSKKDDC